MEHQVSNDGGPDLGILQLEVTRLEEELKRERLRKRFVTGTFHFTHLNSAGQVVDEWDADNIVTDEGLDYILGAGLGNETAIAAWYMGLNGTGSPDGSETYATPVLTELTTEYSEATRPAWVEGGVSSQSMDNSGSPASFSIVTTVTVYGARLCGGGTAADTKGDAAGGGTLFCIAQFASPKALNSGDTLQVTYTIGAADDAS